MPSFRESIGFNIVPSWKHIVAFLAVVIHVEHGHPRVRGCVSAGIHVQEVGKKRRKGKHTPCLLYDGRPLHDKRIIATPISGGGLEAGEHGVEHERLKNTSTVFGSTTAKEGGEQRQIIGLLGLGCFRVRLVARGTRTLFESLSIYSISIREWLSMQRRGGVSKRPTSSEGGSLMSVNDLGRVER